MNNFFKNLFFTQKNKIPLNKQLQEIRDRQIGMCNIISEMRDRQIDVHLKIHSVGIQFQYKFYEKEIKKLHNEVFAPFIDKYNGKNLVIVGTGPSLQKYTPIEEAIHVGVNKSFMSDRVALDYLFMQDALATEHYIDDAGQYRPDSCQKFYGIILSMLDITIPQKVALDSNANRYYTSAGFAPFTLDILNNIFPNFNSVIFSALAFALLTNPKKVYLVGCDATSSGYFDGTQSYLAKEQLSNSVSTNLEGWLHFKNFVNLFYPNLEVISVNPVGLKNLFKDVEQ